MRKKREGFWSYGQNVGRAIALAEAAVCEIRIKEQNKDVGRVVVTSYGTSF